VLPLELVHLLKKPRQQAEKPIHKFEKRVAAGHLKLKSPDSFSFSYFETNASAVICLALKTPHRSILSTSPHILLSPWVGFLIGATDMFSSKMSVNLCGRDIGVTQ